MAKACYNTFVVVDCKRRKVMMVTSSARKAHCMLRTGTRIEVWNCNGLVETIHAMEREAHPMQPYIIAEKEYIGNKQMRSEERNRQRWK